MGCGSVPRPFVVTTCGRIWDEKGKVSYATRAASIRREVEASLGRLKVDAIDLYQLHWPADDLAETEEGWSEMAQLKREGKVRWGAGDGGRRCGASGPPGGRNRRWAVKTGRAPNG